MSQRFTNTRDIVYFLVPRFARGRALDIGAGTAKYRKVIEQNVAEYKTSDLFAGPAIDYVEDATKLSFKDNTWDTVFSFQTLEHVEDPHKMVSEMHRVLKPGGRAIITVPFMVAEHKDPTDFQRFTKDGLAKLCVSQGFTVEECGSYGGYFAVQGEMIKFMFYPPKKRKLYGRMRERIITFILNAFVWLDRKGLSKDPNFYANVYIVAKK